MDPRGKVALVTGASMGLGRRIALDLAAAGATVVGVARGAGALADLDLGDGWTRSLDVSDGEAVRALVDEIVSRHGALDVLINNAGIEERIGVTELTPADVARTMAVNFDGVVHATLAAVPRATMPGTAASVACTTPSKFTAVPGMVARGSGWIVSTISGIVRAPLPRQSAYAASKAAVSAFCEAISYELEPLGVRVKVLSPGFVPSTRMARGAVEHGFRVPPRSVHRTEEQVSRALLRGLDTPGFEINCARLETIAPVARALFPRMFRRGVARTARG